MYIGLLGYEKSNYFLMTGLGAWTDSCVDAPPQLGEFSSPPFGSLFGQAARFFSPRGGVWGGVGGGGGLGGGGGGGGLGGCVL